MADKREAILARYLELAQAVQGVREAARNRTDAQGLVRPAITIHDGAEEMISKPVSETRSRVQLVEMSPQTEIFVGGAPDQIGPLLNLYRARLVHSVLTDATMISLVGTNGEMRYEGCSEFPPTPEQREARMEISLVFRYVFRVEDLISA
jgi:hypothetical protein